MRIGQASKGWSGVRRMREWKLHEGRDFVCVEIFYSVYLLTMSLLATQLMRNGMDVGETIKMLICFRPKIKMMFKGNTYIDCLVKCLLYSEHCINVDDYYCYDYHQVYTFITF